MLLSRSKSQQDDQESLNPSWEALICRWRQVGSSYAADKVHGLLLTGWKHVRLLGRHRERYLFNLLRADVKTENSSSEPRHIFTMFSLILSTTLFSPPLACPRWNWWLNSPGVFFSASLHLLSVFFTLAIT